ncbi:SRPBCC family protein [Nocardioides sp. zg-DK7169]|uniref:SRPBCC family protein n=1 Tax=Nocardioides sp. zg-DK7169 TaxID=2736600 RepID=UPI0015579AD2|nr:SRPBCC family protein [Nocardioides sp. zg-DK7169]NPC98142.1 polyketide cyclase [Nocardioides sp. zg-DK7169]
MTTRCAVQALVEAPVATLWELLADVERMPEWTPSMRSVRLLDGAGLALGTRVEIRQPRMPTLTWTVDEVTPMRHFRWSARSGGVTTCADHWLEPRSEGRQTEVRLAVEHEGRLAGLVGALTMRRTARYLDLEVTGLKGAAEAAVRRDAG